MKFVALLFGVCLIIALFAVSCKIKPSLKDPKRTLKENIIVERTYAGDYSIKLNPAGEWKIYQGPSPEKINWKEPSILDGDFIQFPAPKDNFRAFFAIVSPEGDTSIISERRIPMEGQPNFRDIGGLPTKDGRFVEWGSIYRSGKLSDLTSADLRYFSHLGINTVVDLRNNIEIGKDPDRLPDGVVYVHHSLSDKEGQAYNRLRRMVLREGYRRAKAKALFEDVMRAFADTLAEDVQPIFDILLSEKKSTPILYHCSGGKDRTGYVTAMILSSLGVSRDIIMQDYLMSNFYRRETNIRGMKRARLIGLDQETMEYAFLVREDYMNAVFEVMDEYGGTDQYLEQQFGLNDSLRMELKERYTKPYFSLKVKPELDTIKVQAENKGKE